ncbi:hypothetical protein PPERSA_03660 [Pseudocohnilembus persalinus]|uniref:Uncharacterized protein n=1 Tax=Pseudocohnilembus persalinus TaxID=266149 RepID=A0A0V0QMX1_PSEPJ|nr:hypothetical protein PPERSA_03660 [Pseudocohnilembus persalinus]|eukprot:KRX03699.1 hypothetical protein PPERSA_03660 [Pseudocohnilembus persalinus]
MNANKIIQWKKNYNEIKYYYKEQLDLLQNYKINEDYKLEIQIAGKDPFKKELKNESPINFQPYQKFFQNQSSIEDRQSLDGEQEYSQNSEFNLDLIGSGLFESENDIEEKSQDKSLQQNNQIMNQISQNQNNFEKQNRFRQQYGVSKQEDYLTFVDDNITSKLKRQNQRYQNCEICQIYNNQNLGYRSYRKIDATNLQNMDDAETQQYEQYMHRRKVYPRIFGKKHQADLADQMKKLKNEQMKIGLENHYSKDRDYFLKGKVKQNLQQNMNYYAHYPEVVNKPKYIIQDRQAVFVEPKNIEYKYKEYVSDQDIYEGSQLFQEQNIRNHYSKEHITKDEQMDINKQYCNYFFDKKRPRFVRYQEIKDEVLKGEIDKKLNEIVFRQRYVDIDNFHKYNKTDTIIDKNVKFQPRYPFTYSGLQCLNFLKQHVVIDPYKDKGTKNIIF